MATLKAFLLDKDAPRVIGQTVSLGVFPLSIERPIPPSLSTGETSVAFGPSPIPASSPSSSSSSPSPSVSTTQSLFDRPLSRSTTASSVSTTAYARSTLTQHLATMHFQDLEIPCFLRDTTGCPVSFLAGDIEDICDHSIGHFGSQGPPDHGLCIFCDRRVFRGTHPDIWRNRALHIVEHFVLYNERLETSRPDFHVIKELWKRGSISKDDYDHALLGTERPKTDGLKSPHWEPDEVKAKRRMLADKANRIEIDPRRERRRQGAVGTNPSKNPKRGTRPGASIAISKGQKAEW